MNTEKKNDIIGLLRYYGVCDSDIVGIVNRMEMIIDGKNGRIFNTS